MAYRCNYRCKECRHEFDRITENIPKRDPACPVCRSAKRIKSRGIVSDKTHEMGNGIDSIVANGRAPSVGGSNIGKAMDATAEMVMADYGMTNLNDAKKPGEVMAPKLAPIQQARADSFFGGNKGKGVLQNGSQVKLNQANLAKRAMGGAFKPEGDRNPIGMLHAARDKPKVNIVASDAAGVRK